jgi:thioredoxin 1
MKKFTFGWLILLSAGALFFGLLSCASKSKPMLNSPEGIHFKVLSLEVAKGQAISANKPLFIFAHASWCPTCKQMEKEVLVKKVLGDAFNTGFLNVAIDVDSPEGHDLNQTYPINGTPTLLFFKPGGVFSKKIVGFTTIDELLAVARDFKN